MLEKYLNVWNQKSANDQSSHWADNVVSKYLSCLSSVAITTQVNSAKIHGVASDLVKLQVIANKVFLPLVSRIANSINSYFPVFIEVI